ncbi:hypothetical protein SRABI36_04325 [Pedobacter sp. Bi36]|nr:hypothetical protein SRABI36_04325 [Pedobacter sp. Bi36]CAH0303012.1 hypothetical protein SRABI126_04445 [Pedobacter sp. Bi126]
MFTIVFGLSKYENQISGVRYDKQHKQILG